MEAAAAQRRGTERFLSDAAAAVNEGGADRFRLFSLVPKTTPLGTRELRSCVSREADARPEKLLGVRLTVSVGKGRK
ncbi:unnamed protein product [Linum trigynum]|uniref:Uncharacterized protein n=1 Tax=Linum trigynum TaxID=586398 RepID=A0AAV2FR05_9ROSI